MENCTSQDCFYRKICRSHIDNPQNIKILLSGLVVCTAGLHAKKLIGLKNPELLEIYADPLLDVDRRKHFTQVIRLEQKLGGYDQCFKF